MNLHLFIFSDLSWSNYNRLRPKCLTPIFAKATTSISGVCSIWHRHHPRGQVTLGAFIVLVSPNPWQMKFAKCAASPSSLPRMRYSQCAVGPSSLLRDEVYPVCSEPLIPPKNEIYPVCNEPIIPPERWGLPSVQWAHHPSITKCAVSPSSLTLPERWGLPSVQWAPHPWLSLKDEAYPVRNKPLIYPKDEV